MTMRFLVIMAVMAGGASAARAASKPAPTQEELTALLRLLDDRMSYPTDYSAKVYMEHKRKGQADRVFEMRILRRDRDDKLIILFTKPKTHAGKGYLRIDKNLWYYDPTVGKWERQTERERIAGTEARRRDFDDWDLAASYDPTYVGEEKLGSFVAMKLKLTAKPNADVAFPVMHLWLDTASNNALKMEQMAASGKTAQTTFYPEWVRFESKLKTKTIWYPKEQRIRDDMNDGQQTRTLVLEAVEGQLPENVFTKAWLETQSR